MCLALGAILEMMSLQKLEDEFKISPVKVVLEDAADVRFALDQAMLKVKVLSHSLMVLLV